MNLLVDRRTPTTPKERDTLLDQAARFLLAAGRGAPALSETLASCGYGPREHVEGLERLRAAMPLGEEASAEVVNALHAWLLAQHERVLLAGVEEAQLVELGVVRGARRVIPEESGIVLKGVRR